MDRLIPVQIGIATNWVSVAAGNPYSLAMKNDGTLWSWGSNWSGSLGNGTFISNNIPTQMDTSTNWLDYDAGDGHGIATKNNGSLLGWGTNGSGQLGDSTLTDKNIPTLINSSGVSTLSNITVSLCSNQLPYSWNSQLFSSSGVYTYSTMNSWGCDSVSILNLTINPISTSSSNILICPLQLPYTWNGQSLTASGIYTYLTTNYLGCDSNATLNLTVNTSFTSITNLSICNNLIPYYWNGQSLSVSGIYTYSTTNANGCDSISTLNLNVGSISTKKIIDTLLCSSQLPFYWNGQLLSGAGIYTQTLTNSVGCDSSLILNLTATTPNTVVTQSGYSMWSNAPAAIYQWINCNGNSVIPGATNQGYTTAVGGNYAVIVTQFGCTDTSACHTIFSVNTSDYFSSNAIQINPNPSNGKIVMTTSEPLVDASLKIMNLTGETIFKRDNLNGRNFLFDISNKATGIYFVELVQGDKSQRFKLIKE